MHSILHWIRKEIIKTRWSLCILPIHPCGLGGFYYYLTTFLKTGDAVKLRKRSTQQRTQIRLWMHQFLSHTSYPELLKRLFTGNRCRKRKGNIFVEMFARVGRCFFKFFPEHLEPSIFPQVQNLWDTRWRERAFIGWKRPEQLLAAWKIPYCAIKSLFCLYSFATCNQQSLYNKHHAEENAQVRKHGSCPLGSAVFFRLHGKRQCRCTRQISAG